MPVKVCPVCGKENAEDRKFCSKCFSELGEAMPEQAPPVSTVPERPRGPLTSQQGAYSQPSTPNQVRQVPPVPRCVPEPLPDPKPVEQPGSSAPWGWIIFLVIVLIAGFSYHRYQNRVIPEPAVKADTVVMSFLEAKKTNQIANVRPYISKESNRMLDKALSGRQAESAGFTRKDAHNLLVFDVRPTPKELRKSTMSAVRMDDKDQQKGTATVRATLTPIAGEIIDLTGPDYWYVLVQEEDEWKVDLEKSLKRQGSDIAPPVPGVR